MRPDSHVHRALLLRLLWLRRDPLEPMAEWAFMLHYAAGRRVEGRQV